MILVISIASYFIVGIICAVLCLALASKKGYSGYGFMGFFLGVVALIYVVGLPDRNLLRILSKLQEMPNEHIPETSVAEKSEEKTYYTIASAPSFHSAVQETSIQQTAAAIPQDSKALWGDTMIKCSQCGTVQPANRSICFSCGAHFTKEQSN